jgi:hypothetical protein
MTLTTWSVAPTCRWWVDFVGLCLGFFAAFYDLYFPRLLEPEQHLGGL